MDASVKNILVTLTGALGDIARGFSILGPLKDSYPDAKIYWLTAGKWQEVVRIHPLIHQAIVFNQKDSLSQQVKFIKNLRSCSFDLALDLQRNFKSGILTRLSGARRTIGFNRKNAKEFNWLLNHEQIEYFPENNSKVLHYLKFIDRLNQTSVSSARGNELERKKAEVSFGFEKFDFSSLLPRGLAFSGKKRIGMLLGSSWESKNWPDEYYHELAEKILSDPDSELYLLGDKSKAGLADAICSRFIANLQLINLAGKTTLAQLLATISRLTVITGPDSGPGHLASLVDVPYVGYYGPTDPRRVAPWGSEDNGIIAEIGCAGCLRKNCPGLETLCMKLITPEKVFDKLSR